MVTVTVDQGAQALAGVKVSVLPTSDHEPAAAGEISGMGEPGSGGADSEITTGVLGATPAVPCAGVTEFTSGTGGSVVVVVAGAETVVLAAGVVVVAARPAALGRGPLANKPCWEAGFADKTDDDTTRPALANSATPLAATNAAL